MALPSGTLLRQYEIVEPLGAGSMGEVYRAHDSRLGRDVAIKVLPGHLAGDPYVRARFESEARAIAALSHPNLLAIHEFTLADDTPFAVMELLEGETLRQRLETGLLPWRRALEIGMLVADGLAAAHAKGIIHRDLKPDNVFLTTSGAVKILDFGLASRSPVTAEPPGASPTLAETLPGMVLGTIGYMSPEQLRGLPADARSDLFSLGCMLFEMLTGTLPFAAPTAQEAIAATLRDPVPALPRLTPPAPPEVARIVEHCLGRPAERRFASGRDVVLAIQGVLQGSGPVAVSAARARPRRGKSIAVLPFENVSGDPTTDYLADGLTESIINMLSQLPDLRVIPRTMVFRYKGAAVDPGAAALALNARTLLTGRLVPRGDAITIQAELVDAASESQIWGEQYRRPISDLLSLQEEIAWHISEALRLKLTGEQKKRLRQRPTRSTEAYEEYLRGRYQWNTWTPEGFRKAAGHFERAIEIDPGYALAWSGVGDAYGALAYYGYVGSHEGFPKAESAARKALELDGQLPEAHLTLALCRLFYSWRPRDAEQSFRRAIELKPTLAVAHAFLAFCLNVQGRAEEAVEEARHGRGLEPLALVPNMILAWVLFQAGRFDEALAQAHHTLALDPAISDGHGVAAIVLEQQGRYQEAVRHVAGSLQVFGMPADDAVAAAARLDPSTGEAYWRSKLALLAEAGRQYRIIPMLAAVAHARLGDRDSAVDLLERVVEARAGSVVFVPGDPALEALHGFPRFEALCQRIDLR
jgi:eukaryotic-like serine/threonine-protein kinase